MSVKVSTIDEIEEMWETDSKLDKAELAEQSLETDYLHAKYLKIYRQCKEQMVRLNKSLQKAELDARTYYSGKSDAKVYATKPFDIKVLKQDLDKYVRADSDVSKIEIALEKSKLKVEVCESIIKQLNYRSFTIKNTITYLQFLSGT